MLIPSSSVANDVASATIGGYTFSWAGLVGGTPGGMLNLRIALRETALVDLARALARVEGVRVTSGPAIASRGDCYLVHCSGFKLVLSAPPPGSQLAQGLLSRTIAPTVAAASPLGELFERLMTALPPRVEIAAREASGPVAAKVGETAWPKTSTLRRTALQPGKMLARKTPLTRKTPLGRGRKREP